MARPPEIYLDHNATAPVVPAARAAVLEALDTLGNPSSHHRAGRRARALLEVARERIAAALSVAPATIVFTSGGTESCNLAIGGALSASGAAKRTVATTRIEHAAVLRACERWEIVDLPLSPTGRLEPAALRAALAARPAALVAFASANNEIGTRQPVRALVEIAHELGSLVFVDAVQSFGKVPVDASLWGADLIAVSSHKIGGPKGAGALYVRPGTALEPLLAGGPQEAERRAGTEALPAICGFGAAAAKVEARLATAPEQRLLRDRLQARLLGAVPSLCVHGDQANRLPNTLSVTVPGADGDALRVALDLHGVHLSGGSACAAGAVRPSHVLIALGSSEAEAQALLRFSLGPETDATAIDRAASIALRIIASQR